MSQSASANKDAAEPEVPWLENKNTLHRLYITDKKTLKEVKSVMEAVHGFPTLRLHDYEVALRELNLRKNLKREYWFAIGVEISKRKGQAKSSEVLWNDTAFEPSKVRKEVLRNRNLKHRRNHNTIKLPVGLVIRTPHNSPDREIGITALPSGPAPDPESSISECACRHSSTTFMDHSICHFQIASQLSEVAQQRTSTLRQLRENIPFNRFMLQMLDDSRSQPLLVLASSEPALAASPRLFGCNPSLDVLARVSFELSNKLWISWAEQSSWFLDWLGISADFTVLRTFFSAKTPTVWAMYESLCRLISNFPRPAAARVLFEIQDIVARNKPMAVDGFDFLKVAVHMGSNADGMLNVARRASDRFELVRGRTFTVGRRRLQVLFLAAAARRDMAMMRLLYKAVARFDASDRSYHADAGTIRLLFSVMRQLYGWHTEDPEEVTIIGDYVELLIQGGILTTSLAPPCCYEDRPKVAVRYPASLSVDELVMMCPPPMRASLYDLVTRFSNEHRSFVSKAGVFTAALQGIRGLKAYLHLCNENDCFATLVTLQESLLFAACLDDIDTVSVLLQTGVDPGVGLLSKNQDRYHKGDMSWNPMLVAAAAGSLEMLHLLSQNFSIDYFLRMAPIHEIVQVENTVDRYGHFMGRELRRLENMREQYLHRQNHDSDRDVSSAILHMHCQTDHEPHAPNMKLIPTCASFLEVDKRRLETLSWIRKFATAHNVRQRIDQEIIESALFKSLKTRALKCKRTGYQPCDVLLLEGLVDANSKYRQGDMDLLQASIRAQCSLKVVQFLLSQGFQVHSRPSVDTANTMLHDAILSNSDDRSDIVEILLQKGADYKYCGVGLTVLEACLYREGFSMERGPFPKDVEMFERLLEVGAPVRDQPRAELERWSPMICLLLRLGAEDDLILKVVDAGACLDERGWDNCMPGGSNTPLQEAISRGREKLAKELIERGANVHALADPIFGSTALQAACKLRSSSQFVEYLIKDQGANVNEAASDMGGWTALQGAALRGSLSLAELLLAYGADVNGVSGRSGVVGGHHRLERRRALDVAAMMGRLDMTEFLLKAGGRSSSDGLGGAICIAKGHHHFAVLSVLMDWQREHGSRILKEEAEWQQQNPDLARLLLDPYSEDELSDDSASEGSIEGDLDI